MIKLKTNKLFYFQEKLKKINKININIIYNCLGGGCQGVLTLVATPFYVYYLGIEAYGIFGLLTLLQVIVNNFDFGIPATVTKIVAENSVDENHAVAPILASLNSLYWIIACTMLVFMLVSIEIIIEFFVASTSFIQQDTLLRSFVLIAVYLGVRYPIALYAGVINGLQLMGVQNIIKITTQTLRFGGGVGVLLYESSIESLLIWYLFTAVFEIAVYMAVILKLKPQLFYFGEINFKSLQHLLQYSAGMYALSLTGLLLGQLDRVNVSRILTLEDFGTYSVVYNISILISLIQISVNTASFSLFSQANIKNYENQNILIERYAYINNLMSTLVSFPCILMALYSNEILSIWIDKKFADKSAFCMSILCIGFFFNAIVSNAYTLAIATGKTKYPLYINLISILWYVPFTFVLVSNHGINGASFSWLLLNSYYVLTLVPLVQIKIIKQKISFWVNSVFGYEFLIVFTVVGVSKIIYYIFDMNLILMLGILMFLYALLILKKMVFNIKNN